MSIWLKSLMIFAISAAWLAVSWWFTISMMPSLNLSDSTGVLIGAVYGTLSMNAAVIGITIIITAPGKRW